MGPSLVSCYEQIVTRAMHIARGEPVPSNVPPKPDIILAADCVYFEPAFPLLVQTLADLSHPTTHILFCYKKRRKVESISIGRLVLLLMRRYGGYRQTKDFSPFSGKSSPGLKSTTIQIEKYTIERQSRS